MEKEFHENQGSSNSNYNFYTDRSLKVKDLTIGFFSGLGYVILALSLLVTSYKVSESFFEITLVAVIIFYLLAILFFFYKRRYYLSIGLILLVTVPPAIIGGCLALILK